MLRAKYKKFGSRAEADAFVGNSTPYSKAPDSQQAGSSRASKVVSDHLQPLTQADPSTLPPQLKRVAERGFSFTAEPHYLIVYTDGSSINNGKANARAGLGVYYGSRGQAADSNIAERLPGPTQTNNRGELLVSASHLDLAVEETERSSSVSDQGDRRLSISRSATADSHRLAVRH